MSEAPLKKERQAQDDSDCDNLPWILMFYPTNF